MYQEEFGTSTCPPPLPLFPLCSVTKDLSCRGKGLSGQMHSTDPAFALLFLTVLTLYFFSLTTATATRR